MAVKLCFGRACPVRIHSVASRKHEPTQRQQHNAAASGIQSKGERMKKSIVFLKLAGKNKLDCYPVAR